MRVFSCPSSTEMDDVADHGPGNTTLYLPCAQEALGMGQGRMGSSAGKPSPSRKKSLQPWALLSCEAPWYLGKRRCRQELAGAFRQTAWTQQFVGHPRPALSL